MDSDWQWSPHPAERLVWTEVDDEIVVLDPGIRMVHLLNGTAAVLWQVLDGESSIREIIDDVADAFGLEPAVAERDVEAFVRDMLDRHLIDRHEVADV